MKAISHNVFELYEVYDSKFGRMKLAVYADGIGLFHIKYSAYCQISTLVIKIEVNINVMKRKRALRNVRRCVIKLKFPRP